MTVLANSVHNICSPTFESRFKDRIKKQNHPAPGSLGAETPDELTKTYKRGSIQHPQDLLQLVKV
jgi:hypothetical protein